MEHNLPATIDPSYGVDTYRTATNAATLCGEIVKATAQNIQGRKYVRVEGWMALAAAHGCLVSIAHVDVVEGGIRAVAELKRMADGLVLATAEGFVGDDEPMWAKRPLYARRAMAQTRASSRVCRSAFSHCVVLIDKNLGTTPAEEMDFARDDHAPPEHSWTQEAKRDGLLNNGDERSTYQVDKDKRAKEFADKGIETLNLAPNPQVARDWWKEQGQVPLGKRKSPLDWLRDNSPEQFLRLQTAYENVVGLDAAA